MPRKKSRTQRKVEFMKAAEAMYERMDDDSVVVVRCAPRRQF